MSSSNQLETVAIDIGISKIKVVVSNKNGEITQTLITDNKNGFAVPNNSSQIKSMSDSLKNIFNEHKIPKKNIYLAMPETFTSTQVIEIPTLTDTELATSIHWQAQQYIPIPKEELALNYQVLFRPDKKDEAVTNMRVLLIGINQKNLDNVIAAYKEAGLEPTVLETNTIATIRHHAPTQNTDSASLIVNFGASGIDIIVMKNNEINLAISHQTGSNMITRALMSTFNLPFEKAEEYKQAYGLNTNYFEGKIANAIAPIAQTILNDIKHTMTFFNKKNNYEAINQLFICGGGSLMPGFPELLAANLNLDIQPLDVFKKLNGSLPEKDHLLFPVAAGLIKRN